MIDLVVPPRTSGGGRTFVNNIERNLAALGADVMIVSTRRGIRKGSHVLAVGTRVPWLKRGVTYWPLTVAPLESETVDLLSHTWHDWMHWRLLKLRLLMTTLFAKKLVYSSQYARTLYEKRFPWLRSRRALLCLPSPSVEPSKDQSIGEASGQYRILMVSHLYPYKMAHVAVQTLPKLLHDPARSVTLTFAGTIPDAAYRRRLENLIEELGVRENVRLLGAVAPQDLDALYRDSDAFLFLSISENAGSYALIDALAHGLPIVCSDRGSMREICADAVAYVNPYDEEATAIALDEIYRDVELRRRLADRAASRAADLPRWRETARAVLQYMCETPS